MGNLSQTLILTVGPIKDTIKQIFFSSKLLFSRKSVTLSKKEVRTRMTSMIYLWKTCITYYLCDFIFLYVTLPRMAAYRQRAKQLKKGPF